jgi:hypothetical protein
MAPGTKPPYSDSNCAQFVTRRGLRPSGSVGSSFGAFSVKPTKAAIAVAPAERLPDPDGTSSTYTPGVK